MLNGSAGTGFRREPATMPDRTQRLERLIDIGLALTGERDLHALLERILEEARWFTRAEAGTLFLRDGDRLRFAVVQNEILEARLGKGAMPRHPQAAPLPLSEPSAAGHIVGVLELLNARDEGGASVPFDPADERLIRALAAQAAVAIRNAQLEDLSFKDALTDLFNERYFALRLDEEVKETARLLAKHSRSFTILARRAGDDFVAILANTPKAGAATYAERIRGVLEHHAFAQGPVTACFGVAALPADASSAEDLMLKADRTVSDAKRLGRNRVTTF